MCMTEQRSLLSNIQPRIACSQSRRREGLIADKLFADVCKQRMYQYERVRLEPWPTKDCSDSLSPPAKMWTFVDEGNGLAKGRMNIRSTSTIVLSNAYRTPKTLGSGEGDTASI
jgi:hypothetical protein